MQQPELTVMTIQLFITPVQQTTNKTQSHSVFHLQHDARSAQLDKGSSSYRQHLVGLSHTSERHTFGGKELKYTMDLPRWSAQHITRSCCTLQAVSCWCVLCKQLGKAQHGSALPWQETPSTAEA